MRPTTPPPVSPLHYFAISPLPLRAKMKQVLAPVQVDELKALVLEKASSIGTQEEVQFFVVRLQGLLGQMTAWSIPEELRELMEAGDTEPDEEDPLAQASYGVDLFGCGVMSYEQELFLLRCLLSVAQALERPLSAVKTLTPAGW